MDSIAFGNSMLIFSNITSDQQFERVLIAVLKQLKHHLTSELNLDLS